jgi:integrase
VRRVLDHLEGNYRLVVALRYDWGLRRIACLRLREQDVDRERRELLVRHGQVGQDRRTMRPEALVPGRRRHLNQAAARHRRERARGRGQVRLPEAMDRQAPGATAARSGQGVFPPARFSQDPRSGFLCRHHAHDGPVLRATHVASG